MEEWGIDALLGLVVIAIGFGAVMAYPPLQYSAIRELRHGWRAAAFLPLAVMGVVMAVTVPALIGGSNLWPLYLIFVTPLATVSILVLRWVHRFVSTRKGGA